MLRIHFTPADLARVRLNDGADPLWEILLSLHLVQSTIGSQTFGHWRRLARAELTSATGLLTVLAPPTGYSADFLTPPVAGQTLLDGIEALCGTAKPVLHRDLTRLAAERRLPGWAGELARGEAPMLRRLGTALHQYHRVALAPYWPAVTAAVQTDRQARSQALLSGGLDRLFSTLHPAIRWQAPVLEVDYPVEQDLHLDGRGLLLIPSFFCWGRPITLEDPDQPPVLVYPVARTSDWSWSLGERPTGSAALGTLLGRTRAQLLDTIASTPSLTTTELAKLMHISLAGASQHASVLRNAGLITTERRAGAAYHRLSAGGSALLDSSRTQLRQAR
ncbi:MULTISPECIES: helix-turn-helix transcriptional regulator [unclassified Crossiella]|uniref:ArsR/SmtB family transcription factor n=1 Tax=unclassified Crossiella TaxID=2620835 RepID=UPI001FFE6115|nr:MULTISPECIES: helix-turn-helix domain-containing protein [unclassified Crossiella]MCK2242729.1 helix-turn-helix domain-containing protein [Crossiella sp. S99.2]MCK2256606.1 helix-turn-helix domain-containing protein [Crossiella sp. S99.1]